MKKLSLLLTILLFSQMAQAQGNDGSYVALWKKVQKLESEALTKSALKVVDSISKKAKKDKNSAQTVKALLYASKYVMTLEEDAQLSIINNFKSEIEKAQFPTKNILESYLAKLFWRYFQQNRHQFYNRTKTETKVDTTDFRTWDLTTLFHEIGIHFDASLENKAELQKTGLEDFKKILKNQPDSETYRPTLFHVLAHTALEFYSTTENSITRPADKFEINDPQLLCEAYEFTQRKIDIHDATSLQSKALLIYQDLLKFHFSEPKLDALVAIDIDRLGFTYQNAVFQTKDEVYLEVLQNSAENLKQHEASALYTYEIARLYHQQGNTYQVKVNEESRWKQKDALELCERVIAKFPDSRAADKCKALKSQILATSLQLNIERHIPIKKPSRLLVNYKNLDGLQLTAHKISQGELKELNSLYPQSKQLAFIQKLPLTKKWEASVKNEMDYQQHNTEILLPPLENGQYVILATPKDSENKTFAFSPVQVTDMALIETHTATQFIYQVIDRHNGEPISGAKLNFSYLRNYNKPQLNKTLTTDKMGRVSIPLSNENWSNVNVVVSRSEEKAFFGEYYINEKYDTNPKYTDYSCFLFTDRSIYRPGQPLYFKGIAIKNTQGVSAILENTLATVELKDVNGQTVGTQHFKTNAYGSFSGEFILPNTGLTGNFSLQVNAKKVALNGRTDFSIEEYKRPKFETSFEPITETYKVNDSVTVNGTATAFAGSMITDAKVSYRVKRAVYFPRWYYWHYPYYNSTPQEIAHGETTTDAAGKYAINFKALPDNGVSKKNLPTFNYEVTADVTDINGETHSVTTFVTVGYHALTATINVPDPLYKDKKDNRLTLSTSNLNGQFVPAQGTLKMYRLKAPEHVLRPRPWAAPDYATWDKEEFKKLFPHDAFSNEHDPINWEKGKMVWQAKFDTGKATEIGIGAIKKWASGKYVIELETRDKFGQIVKDVAQTTVISDNDKKLADNQLFHIKTDKDTYSAGDDLEVTLSSSATDLTVSVFAEKDRKIIDTQLVRLSDNSKTFTVPVTVDDLGGFAINYSFSAYNSFQSGSLAVSVPYPPTDLEIETVTFRNKLQPGTDEIWSFKIKGPKGDKVAAELLASMYDASLDAFQGHNWSFNPLMRPTYYSNSYTNANNSFGTSSFRTYLDNKTYSFKPQYYDAFEWFGLYFGNNLRFRTMRGAAPMAISAPTESAAMEMEADKAALDEVVTIGYGSTENKGGQANKPEKQQPKEEHNEEKEGQETAFDDVKIRKNLQETAFFFPQLQTDEEGNISFSFTTPEALTKWKLQLLAHTKSLQSAVTTLQTVTQKELIIIPNAPRFLREGDEITISTKIANLTDKTLSGLAKLELVDAVTGKNISKKILISPLPGEMPQAEGDKDAAAIVGLGEVNFRVDSLNNTQVSWRLKIPEGVQAIQYTIIAKAGDFSDGEQNVLPVLTNRMLVTETLPMWVGSNQTKTFVLEKLKDNTSTTLRNHQLTLEITSNPAWYAVQALPYLMEYPYECNEQTFARYYANTLASHIANSNPRIQDVFQQWANSDDLISNLEKNEELKSLLIQETPWLRDAQSETEQKKRIALLFNLDKMKNEQATALNKLKNNQKTSGAWAWFNGGPDNRFITQHIVTGLGHLKKLNVTLSAAETEVTKPVIQKAIAYLDSEFIAAYNRMKKYATDINEDHLSQTQINYLYMRSFFKEFKTSKKVNEITAYYQGQAQKYWTKKGLYSKGMLVLALHRMDDTKTSAKILKSLKENSINSEELGMYWKENTASWHWYQAPIETQALLIEAFSEIENDIKTIDNLKIWLLKNKQTNQWKTTKATTEAIYALLLQGNDWLSVTDVVDVLVGGEKIKPTQLENVKVESGTGYFKTSWNGNEVKPKMAEVQISKKGEGIAWGALYWQYFEDLDKITSAETPLKLKKKLFLKKNTHTGEEISEITETTDLEVGDMVRVRIELRSDRDMEFVHMKDMRAAGFEPINVLSQYKWQDGLGYYESTKDASTNFFFDYLPKGVYVFEYDLRVNNAGEFSNGITTIQSMYAPEFSSHSEGVRVEVR